MFKEVVVVLERVERVEMEEEGREEEGKKAATELRVRKKARIFANIVYLIIDLVFFYLLDGFWLWWFLVLLLLKLL